MALTKTQVSMLYVAIFNRASEGAGNEYWQNTGLSLSETASEMLESKDAQDYFGTTLDTNQAFVEWIYINTFNKTVAQDPDGIKSWVDLLDAGKTKGEVVEGIVNAVAQNKDATDATTKAAYNQFMNRVEVSDYTADNFEGADLATTMSDYKTKLGFNDDLTVTDDATTVTTAESIVDGLTTTTSPVQVLTTSPDNLTGTNGDDTFDGSVVQNQINGANVDTFTSSDRIDGGTGNDTLIIQQNGDNTATSTVSGAVSNVENIEFTAFGNKTYDMSNTTGVENFLNQNSVADVTVTGASAMDIGVKNVNGKDTNITFASTVYQNTDDSTTLTLENVTGDANIQLTGGDIETLNLESKTAGNKVDLGGTALDATTTLMITGDKDLSVDTAIDNSTLATLNMGKLATVDASAFTGDLDLDFNVLANIAVATTNNKLNITGGTGDDRVIMTDLTKDDVIDLGDGDDELAVLLRGTDSIASAPSLKNIENIAFASGVLGQDRTINLDGATELESLVVRDGTAELKFKNVASSIEDVNFLNMRGTATTQVDSVDLRLKDDSGTSDTLALNFASVDGKLQPVQMATATTLTVNEITANGIENITITTASLGKDDTEVSGVQGGLVVTDFNADSVKKLTIISDTKVDLNTNVDNLNSTIAEIDASAANGGVELDLTNVADTSNSTAPAVKVTTGSGVDAVTNVNMDANVTITTNAGNDTIATTGSVADKKAIKIDSGAGNDTIDVSSHTVANDADADKDGTITITTGDGVDTVMVNAANAVAASADDDYDYNVTITDFSIGTGGDKIDFNGKVGASTTYLETQATAGTNVVGAGGLDVIHSSTNVADSLSITDMATFLNSGNVNYSGNGYVVVTDGSDSALLYVNDGGNADVSNTEIDVIVTLSGVSNTEGLHADNFADFL